MQLTPIELRVLGSLIEKEITTPENYPLSLNALQSAANQRSSRDPVLELNEEELRQALHTLGDMGLVTPVRDSRVPKYEHRARTVLNLRRDETAIVCLLLLRGPQTPGELRARADRLYPFDDIGAVIATLDRLAGRPGSGDAGGAHDPNRTGPLTAALPRQPGSREIRYRHLLGDAAAATQASASMQDGPAGTVGSGTVPPGQLRSELELLRQGLDELRQQVADLTERLGKVERRGEADLPNAGSRNAGSPTD